MVAYETNLWQFMAYLNSLRARGAIVEAEWGRTAPTRVAHRYASAVSNILTAAGISAESPARVCRT